MAVRRYGFYLMSERKRTSERCFQHKKIKSVSPSGHVIFFYYMKSSQSSEIKEKAKIISIGIYCSCLQKNEGK